MRLCGAENENSYEESEPQTRGADHPNSLRRNISNARLLKGNWEYLN